MSQEILVPFLGMFVGAALTFAALWVLIGGAVARRRERERRRLGGEDTESPFHDEVLARQSEDGLAKRFDHGFEQMVARTGLDMAPALALGIILFCGVAVGGAALVWRYETEPWLAFPGFFLGAGAPLLFFLWRQSAWRRSMQNQLPDAFFLLARAMRAGRSLDQSFQLVGEQGVQPLAREFARMYRQMELGLSLGTVLHSTAQRLNLVDFSIFASLVNMHRETGGNLAATLDRLAVSSRDRNQFEGQYRAATVLGRYSAGFLIFLVCVITGYLFLFQHDWALRFFATSTGIFLFATAIALEILGSLLLYWFLRYDY